MAYPQAMPAQGGFQEPGEPQSIIELSIECKNLVNRDIGSQSDPSCALYIQNDPRQVSIRHACTSLGVRCYQPFLSVEETLC